MRTHLFSLDRGVDPSWRLRGGAKCSRQSSRYRMQVDICQCTVAHCHCEVLLFKRRYITIYRTEHVRTVFESGSYSFIPVSSSIGEAPSPWMPRSGVLIKRSVWGAIWAKHQLTNDNWWLYCVICIPECTCISIKFDTLCSKKMAVKVVYRITLG